MSTIEEAREQAREALPGALARLVENRLGKSLAREADKDMIVLRAAANAIVALLDATEPPAPLSIEDFITGTTDGEVDTDEFFADLDERPAEDEREALKYLCRRHAACRSTGWPPYFEHSVGCAEWNSGRVAEGARR